MARSNRFGLVAGLVLFSGLASPVFAQVQGTAASPTKPSGAIALTDSAWATAHTGDYAATLATLKMLPADSPDARLAALRASVDSLEKGFAERENLRNEEMAKAQKALDELLAGEINNINLSKALKEAVTLHMISKNKDQVLNSAQVQKLIGLADAAAKKAEADADWLSANELFGRLHLLMEESAVYKHDARRLVDRLGMIRLYVPQRLWELRNQRRIEEKLSPLAAYNAAGDDWSTKLRGVTQEMVAKAISRADDKHVEKVGMRELLIGGLVSVRTMVTTPDLQATFPGLKEQANVSQMTTFIDRKIAELKAMVTKPSTFAANAVISDLTALSKQSVKIADEAIWHEFGNGAFDRLDEFSQIIWPDEVARFRRVMEANFVGVGIQIQMDDETQMIKVVNPLEGTPAFRAGIRPGDLIKKINDVSAVGMGLDQAVEQITGKSGSKVKLTLERDGEDLVLELTREQIPIVTVKGWKRSGPKETDWDYFIDQANGIGYLRLSGFNNTSTREMHAAISQMKDQGLRGLIFDLRFNPGGLLTEAVSISNMFISEGTVVYTESNGQRDQTLFADSGRVELKDIPTIVLINNGSASASEIVSGALKHYADQKQINVLVMGDRSYGKGSVQNVMPLSRDAQMKLTTQYYFLPNGNLVHRRPNATKWGVEPHLAIEMLPNQITDALLLRQDADVIGGRPKAKKKDPEKKSVLDGPNDVERLLNENLDLQLKTALILMQGQTINQQIQAAQAEGKGKNNGG